MKWILAGFILWLAMKGRFSNYAQLAGPGSGAPASKSSAGPAAAGASTGPTPPSMPGASVSGTPGELSAEIFAGGGSPFAPGSAIATR
jgi:hypothetical protein